MNPLYAPVENWDAATDNLLKAIHQTHSGGRFLSVRTLIDHIVEHPEEYPDFAGLRARQIMWRCSKIIHRTWGWEIYSHNRGSNVMFLVPEGVLA